MSEEVVQLGVLDASGLDRDVRHALVVGHGVVGKHRRAKDGRRDPACMSIALRAVFLRRSSPVEGSGPLLGPEGHDDDGDKAHRERDEDDPQGRVAGLAGVNPDILNRGLRG